MIATVLAMTCEPMNSRTSTNWTPNTIVLAIFKEWALERVTGVFQKNCRHGLARWGPPSKVLCDRAPALSQRTPPDPVFSNLESFSSRREIWCRSESDEL